jgi:hypothetical protein
MICFSVNQSKFLLKTYYKLQTCDTLRNICEVQLDYCDSALQAEKKVSANFSMVIKNNKDAFKIYDYAIVGYNNKLKDARRQTRKQIVYKWVAIAVGGAATGAMTYLWIKK